MILPQKLRVESHITQSIKVWSPEALLSDATLQQTQDDHRYKYGGSHNNIVDDV